MVAARPATHRADAQGSLDGAASRALVASRDGLPRVGRGGKAGRRCGLPGRTTPTAMSDFLWTDGAAPLKAAPRTARLRSDAGTTPRPPPPAVFWNPQPRNRGEALPAFAHALSRLGARLGTDEPGGGDHAMLGALGVPLPVLEFGAQGRRAVGAGRQGAGDLRCEGEAGLAVSPSEASWGGVDKTRCAAWPAPARRGLLATSTARRHAAPRRHAAWPRDGPYTEAARGRHPRELLGKPARAAIHPTPGQAGAESRRPRSPRWWPPEGSDVAG